MAIRPNNVPAGAGRGSKKSRGQTPSVSTSANPAVAVDAGFAAGAALVAVRPRARKDPLPYRAASRVSGGQNETESSWTTAGETFFVSANVRSSKPNSRMSRASKAPVVRSGARGSRTTSCHSPGFVK